MNHPLMDTGETPGYCREVDRSAYQQGEALANSGNYEAALSCFDQALTLDSRDADAWVFRAVVLVHLQRYEEAVDSCDQALQLAPGHSEAWLFRGAALQHLQRYQDAYQSYDNALGIQRMSWVQQWQSFLRRWM